MFFAKPGEYKPCGLFSIGHLLLLLITITTIIIGIKHTDVTNKENVKKIIRNITIIAWILEVVKISFNFLVGNGKNPNTYIPLYYCSLLLYAGIFSSVCKGTLKKVGDVFLETGAIVAGVVFLIFPNTSIVTYPIFHFISIQSFAFHGMMVYLGIIMNKANYLQLTCLDVKYYATLIILISTIAYIVNILLDSNLMFVSKDFPNSPLTILYKFAGQYYPIIMTLIQAFPPFYLVICVKRKIRVKKIGAEEYCINNN